MKTTSITSLAFLAGIMMFMPVMADKPNVILVISDDPGWTQTGYYGHPIARTPNLDDMVSTLAHGSIVAREYVIPAVLGVGDGTKRIAHGQMITIDGDAGTVEIHEQIEESA